MAYSYKVIIPVRLASTRLPEKPLLLIGDKPLIQHVYESATMSSARTVIIATDSREIREVAEGFGAVVHMTSARHTSGTERLIEVVQQRGEDDEEIIVNLQGDEFNMPPGFIDRVAGLLNSHPETGMATLCEPITDPEHFNDPHFVKVTFNTDQIALNFSREPVPWPEAAPALPGGVFGYGHIGMYAYRVWFLKRYSGLERCEREVKERLEQLRVLEHGLNIRVGIVPHSPGLGIDTPADLEAARKMWDQFAAKAADGSPAPLS